MKKGDKCIFIEDDLEDRKEKNRFRMGDIVTFEETEFMDVPDVRRANGEIGIAEPKKLRVIPDELLNEDPQTILLYFAL